jgi:hypothetical protein
VHAEEGGTSRNMFINMEYLELLVYDDDDGRKLKIEWIDLKNDCFFLKLS